MKKFYLLLLLFVADFCEAYEITIVAITKSDHIYLQEWIEYHQLIGVDHFCIYDNNEGNETALVLEPYIKSGLVDYVSWPNLWPELDFFKGCQHYAYQDGLEKCRENTIWTAFIDTDEFIVPNIYTDLRETLMREFIDKPLIYVNWRRFGTGGQTIYPSGNILSTLTRCSPRDHTQNIPGKTIAQPAYLIQPENPHCFLATTGYVNGSAEPFLYSSFSDIIRRKMPVNDRFLTIHHYEFRDEWFFRNIKIPRLRSRTSYSRKHPEETERKAEMYNEIYSECECFRILDVINLLKKDKNE